jgi:hypothetical protein
MKKTTRVSALGGAVVALLLLGAYGTAFGQGQLTFFTYNATNAAEGLVFQSGGVTLAGSAFDAILLGSTTIGGIYTVLNGSSTGVQLSAGGYNGTTITITSPVTSIGETFFYELAVWSASAGSDYSTAYALAQITGGDQYGTTAPVAIILGGDSNHFPLNTSGFNNLTLTLVPEPATCALMGLGGLSLLLFRRRK